MIAQNLTADSCNKLKKDFKKNDKEKKQIHK